MRAVALGALALGRSIRFSALALLGSIYGRHITRFFSQYYKPTLAVLAILVAAGLIVFLIQYLRHRGSHNPAAA